MTQSALELYLDIDEAVRLAAALDAFDRLTAGDPPDRDALAAAPLLSNWRRTMVPAAEPALIGQVSDHPLLPGARNIVTSGLLLLDAQAGWARTLSGLYRLGPAAR